MNTGATGQSKAGGLILNTGGAATGLIVDQGKVGIGETNPGAKLHVGGTAGTDGIMFPDGTLQTTAGIVGDPSHVDCYEVNLSFSASCASGYFFTYIERSSCPGAYCAATCCKPW